jgi:hypothetical protein
LSLARETSEIWWLYLITPIGIYSKSQSCNKMSVKLRRGCSPLLFEGINFVASAAGQSVIGLKITTFRKSADNSVYAFHLDTAGVARIFYGGAPSDLFCLLRSLDGL